MTSTTFVFLVRHGEAAMPDGQGRWGRNSAELTPRGIGQVQRLAAALAPVPIDALYCSTLLRARQSAELIGEQVGLAPVELKDLHEIDIGALEGVTLEALDALHSAFRPWIECSFFGRFPAEDFHHPADLCFPDGEDVHAMVARALPAFLDLVRTELGRTCVLVSHAWLIQALLCHVTGTPVTQYYRYAGRNASMNLVEVDRIGRGLLHLLNANDVLAEVAGGRLIGRGTPR